MWYEAWTLRPYLVRPRTPAAPFLRSVESSFLGAVATSFDSARGIYHRESAPLPCAHGGHPASACRGGE